MEVESRSLSNFDLNSKPPFSYSVDIGGDDSHLRYPGLRAAEMPQSPVTDSPGSSILESPATIDSGADSQATVDEECEGTDTVSPANDDRRGIEISESVGAATPVGGPANYKVSTTAAMKLQKVYRSYRTRRMLADSAVVVEELWWQAIDYARLNHSTISFFNFSKPETAASRWNRISLNASKVGKGLSKDAKAQKLAFQHWIEAIDPRHRYGHRLHIYYEEWCKSNSGQPFFYWLDIGDGKDIDLKECPRSKLRQECIRYLGPQEREHYEYVIVEGKIEHKQSGHFLDTSTEMPGVKWIFVMSTSKKLYVGQKKKGMFHHSSFLAGGATLAAGRLEAEDGTLKSISAYSGHYRPTEDSLDSFLDFLKENGVNLDQVEIRKANEDSENSEESKLSREYIAAELPTGSEIPHPVDSKEEEEEEEDDISLELTAAPQSETKNSFQRTLSGGLQSPRAEVPKTAILQRINSKKAASSYQLGHQLSRKWSTGAGPRIGCVNDYPLELRLQALEFVNLSPRTPPTPSIFRWMAGLSSPIACPESDLYNDHLISTV